MHHLESGSFYIEPAFVSATNVACEKWGNLRVVISIQNMKSLSNTRTMSVFFDLMISQSVGPQVHDM
jgi:hypothetical protein